MELVGIDISRMIYLTNTVRPSGQVYLPEAAAKLIQRYSFAKYPSTDELTKDSFMFGIGKFQDVQINDFQIYNDGLIVSARANTKVLDAFVTDLFSWAKKEFGLEQVDILKRERHFESIIVVKAKTDLTLCLKPNLDAIAILNRTVQKAEITSEFKLSGFIADCDQSKVTTRRKPMRFIIERRLGISFDENVFYCHAPLETDSHLAVLAELESLALMR